MCDCVCVVTGVHTGQEEVDYWTKVHADKKAKESRHRGQKRKYPKRRDERPVKQSKTEE